MGIYPRAEFLIECTGEPDERCTCHFTVMAQVVT